jgi:hypothetical protein
MVDEPVPTHPVPHAGLGHQVDGPLLQDARLDGLLDVVAGAQVDDDRVDAAQVQQVRQHQPGRARSDDPHLCAHH